MKAEDEIRLDERHKIQKYMDGNNIYQVEFGHYEPPLMMKWIPLKTTRINLEEELKNETTSLS